MSAQRGNFHLRTGGRTPHFFEIGENAKNPFKQLNCKARGVMQQITLRTTEKTKRSTEA